MYNKNSYDHLLGISSPDLSGSNTPVDRAPLIETAEITHVDKILWTCSAKTVYTGRNCINMDIPSFGQDRIGGFGGYMPQVGDRVLVAFPSDELFPQIIAFRSIPSQNGGLRGLKKDINPGDYILCTSDMNYIHVLKGGAIDISSTPMSRRAYIPILNQIKDICENYTMSTPGGIIKWETRREDLSSSGNPESEVIRELKRSYTEDIFYRERMGKVLDAEDLPDHVSSITNDFALYEEIINEDGKVYLKWVDSDGNLLVQTAADTEIISSEKYCVFSSNGIFIGEKVTTDPQSGGIRITNGKVLLSEAKEPAVLGDTLLNLLTDYDSYLREFTASVRSAALAASTAAAAAVTSAPGSPNSLSPTIINLATSLINATSTLESKLLSTSSKFRNFLAKHVELS